MPFGYNMNKVDSTKKEDFVEKKSNSDKQEKDKSIKSKPDNQFKVKSYITDKTPNVSKKYKNTTRDSTGSPDMSFYHKPWHKLTPSQRSAVSDMDSIMDY